MLNQELRARTRDCRLIEAGLRTLLERTRGAHLLIDAALRVGEAYGLGEAGLPEATPGVNLRTYAAELGLRLAELVEQSLASGLRVEGQSISSSGKTFVVTVEPIVEADRRAYVGAWLEFDVSGETS